MIFGAFVIEHILNNFVRCSLEHRFKRVYLLTELRHALFEFPITLIIGGKRYIIKTYQCNTVSLYHRILDLYCTAVLIILQLQYETQFEGVNILIFTIEMTIMSFETSLEFHYIFTYLPNFLKIYVEFVWFTTGLKFIVCNFQFLSCVVANLCPVKHKTHVAGLYLAIILLLFAQMAHGLIKKLPFGNFKFNATALKHAVKMRKKIG